MAPNKQLQLNKNNTTKEDITMSTKYQAAIKAAQELKLNQVNNRKQSKPYITKPIPKVSNTKDNVKLILTDLKPNQFPKGTLQAYKDQFPNAKIQTIINWIPAQYPDTKATPVYNHPNLNPNQDFIIFIITDELYKSSLDEIKRQLLRRQTIQVFVRIPNSTKSYFKSEVMNDIRELEDYKSGYRSQLIQMYYQSKLEYKEEQQLKAESKATEHKFKHLDLTEVPEDLDTILTLASQWDITYDSTDTYSQLLAYTSIKYYQSINEPIVNHPAEEILMEATGIQAVEDMLNKPNGHLALRSFLESK